MGLVLWRGSFAPITVKKFLESPVGAGALCSAGAGPGVAGSISFVLYSTTASVGGGSYPNSFLPVDPASGTRRLVGQPAQGAHPTWLTVIRSTRQSAMYAINPNTT